MLARSFRLVLTWIVVVASVSLVSFAVNIPQAAADPDPTTPSAPPAGASPVVTLTTDRTTVAAGESAHLTATVQTDLELGTQPLLIKDTTYGSTLASCQSGRTCTADAVVQSGPPRKYVATLGDDTSNEVTVTREPWSVALTVDNSAPVKGQSVTFTARTNQNLEDAIVFAVYLFDRTDGHLVKQCRFWDRSASRECRFPVTDVPASAHRYSAAVAKWNQAPSEISDLDELEATSNEVTISPSAWSVTLQTDRSTLESGDTATLTATTNQPISSAPGYAVLIFDKTDNVLLRACAGGSGGNDCSTDSRFRKGAPHKFVAVVASSDSSHWYSLDDVSDVQATSGEVELTRNPWAAALTTDANVLVNGQSATVTVTVNQKITQDPDYGIFLLDADSHQVIRYCSLNDNGTDRAAVYTSDGHSCETKVRLDRGDPLHVYAAVAEGTGNAPYTDDQLRDVQTTSNLLEISRAPWTITISADRTTFTTDEVVHLTARTNQDPSANSAWEIFIYDLTAQKAIGHCTTSPCEIDTAFYSGPKHDYVATIGSTTYPSGSYPHQPDEVYQLQALSNEVSAKRAPWTITATMTQTTDLSGYTYATFQTHTNQAIDGHPENSDGQQRTHVMIMDARGNSSIGACYTGRDCTIRVQVTPGSGVYAPVLVPVVGRDSYGSSLEAVGTVYETDAIGAAFLLDSGQPTYDETLGGSNPSEAGCNGCAADPVSTLTGEYFETETDLALPGTGPALDLERTTSTGVIREGPLGVGWTLSSDVRLQFQPSYTDDHLPFGVTVLQENGSSVAFLKIPNGSYIAAARVMATLEHDQSDDSWLFTRRVGSDFTRMRFNSYGRLLRVADRHGNTVTYGYDDEGHLVSATAAGGRSIAYSWADGHITAAHDSAGREVSFGYAGNLLTSVTAVDGGVTRYGYYRNRVVSITAPGGGVTSNNLDNEGRVGTQSDPLGRYTFFSYEGSYLTSLNTTVTRPDGSKSIDSYINGRLVQRTLAPGTSAASTYTYTFDSAGNQVSVTDPAGAVISYTYDTAGNRKSTTDPLGRTTRWTYSASNDVESVTDANGDKTQSTFSPEGDRLTITSPSGNVERYAYNSDGTVDTDTDPLGNAAHFGYDAAGRLTSSTDPDGHTTRYGYDSAGRVTTQTDPTGRVTRTDYDDAGRVLWSEDPAHHRTTSTYTPDGLLESTTDANGNVTSYDYDAAGEQIAVTDPLGHTTHYTYDPNGQPSSVTDPRGRTTSTTYDRRGNPSTTTDAKGKVTSYLYDGDDRLLSTTRPSGAVTTVRYNVAGEVTSSEDADGDSTSYTYDDLGRVLTTTDPLNRVTSYRYTEDGQTEGIDFADGSSEEYTYDKAGQKSGYTDRDGHETTYAYTDSGRLASATRPGNKTTSYSYDHAGRPQRVTLPDASKISNSYDAAGRLGDVTFSDTTGQPTDHAIHYTYDSAGRRTAMSDGTGTSTYAFDDDGRLTSATNGAGATVAYSYNATDDLAFVTYPGGDQIEYHYDALGQMTSATDWNGDTTQFTWSDDNRLATQTNPNGVVSTWSQDAAGNTTDIEVANTQRSLAKFHYQYDAATQLTDDRVTNGSDEVNRSYTYTRTSQLKSATTQTGNGDADGGTAGSSPASEEYTTSPGGQLTGLPGGVTLDYNSAQQLTSLTPAAASSGDVESFTYDVNGQRVGAASGQHLEDYSYSTAGMLTHARIRSGGGADVSLDYTYDGSGLRQSRARTDNGGGNTTGAATEQLTWDANGGLPVLLEDGTHRYLYGPSATPYAQVSKTDAHDSTAFEYLHCDVLGSVRVITDDDGTKIGATTYSPYGTVTEHTGTATSALGYTGNLTDPDTGLIYLRARDYQPSTGQFLTVDPAVDTTHQPYAYVDGNPITRTDPTGLFWGEDWIDDRLDDAGDFVADNFGKDTWGGHFLSAANGYLDTVTFGGSTALQEVISPGSSCAYKHDGWYKSGQLAGYLVPGAIAAYGLTRLAIGAARFAIATGFKAIARGITKALAKGAERRVSRRAARDPLVAFAKQNPGTGFASEYRAASGKVYRDVTSHRGSLGENEPFGKSHHGGCSEIGCLRQAYLDESNVTGAVGGTIRTIRNRPPNSPIPPGPPRGLGTPATPCASCQEVLDHLGVTW